MEKVNVHDKIKFYISCNADRKLFVGIVSYKEQLGLITIIDGIQYELRKLIDIEIIESFNSIENLELQLKKTTSLLTKLVKHNFNPLTNTPAERYYKVLRRHQEIRKQLTGLYQERSTGIS